MSNTMNNEAITAIRERESAYRHNCGPFGHVAQEQATQAFADIETLLRALAERDAELIERDQRYANDKQDADGDPASLCNICRGMIRYGERHSTCGRAFMEIERQLAAVTAERDAIKRTREQEEKYDHLCWELQQARERLAAYDAALTQVRAEMPKVEQVRAWVRQMDKLFGNDWSYANKATCDRHTDAENLLAAIDSLQLAEAANRNAIAVAQLTIKYVREERQALVEQNGRIFQQLNTAEARAGELELQAVSLRTVISTICDRIGAERSFDEILSGQRIMAWIDSLTSPLPEASQAKPVAWVPLHPRTGPLWANTTANLELDRPIYPLMALYASPLPADATGPYGDGSMCQDCPPFGSYNLKRCQWCPRKSFAQPQGE